MSQKSPKEQPVPPEKAIPSAQEAEEILRTIATGCGAARTLLDPNRPSPS